MKVIGRIEGIFNSDGECQNPQYLGGSIVELTEREVHTIKALQDSCNGRNWRDIDILSSRYDKLYDTDMAEAFSLVWTFAKTRFAVNDFKSTVNELEEILNRLDEKNV